MTQFKTFSDFERAALKAHGLDTKRPSQLSDAFVLGMRYAATVAEGLDCAHGCGVGSEVAHKMRGGTGLAVADTRKPCTCDGDGRGPGRECVVQRGGRLGELWRCAQGYEPASGVPEGGKCQAPEVCGEAKECRYRCYAHPSGVPDTTNDQPKEPK